MALPILKAEDFIGKENVSQSRFDKKDLTEYIACLEKQYLDDLLGCTLADLLIADLDASNVPQTAIYQNIWDEFCEDLGCGQKLRSIGIPEMLKKFLYWEYVKDQPFINTPAGMKKQNGENSIEAEPPAGPLYVRYNEGIKTYQAIQEYICRNKSDYPDYNGSHKQINSWL